MLFVAIAACLLPIHLEAQEADIEKAAATITEDDYAWRVGVIAHDSMQGRNTPSPGLDKTAVWIASEFRRFGLRGGNEDGSFIQRYPLEEVMVDAGASGMTADGIRLDFGSDLLPLFGSPASLEISAELVVVSGSTDTAELPAEEIRGKHAAVVLGPGQAVGRQVFGLVMAVRGAGAVSVMVTSSVDDAAWAGQVARGLRPAVRWPGGTGGGRGGGAPLLQVRVDALERLLAGTGLSVASLQERSAAGVEAHAVPGMSLTLTQQVEVGQTSAPNVVGILEGSDPELKDEYVVFSGHMDHVGIGTPDENGDSIFNGADDDASGTISVVEAAEAMVSLATAPRRSMVFLVVSGEEKGLWGSQYYADNPSVPVDQLVANLNADMVGRNWPDTIVAIGKEHSDLGETLNRVNERHPELRMTAIDDIWPEERFYFRSDHYNFARKGVPILFFFNGTHDDYHGLDDEPERIDAEKAARITKLLFYLGVEIGNADERPRWNPESYRQIVSDF
jgi:Zn-dependent M28 family amino/carboxypeptidase